MTPRFSLSPLFGSSVGFDRFDSLFESLARSAEVNEGFPPYNIEREGDDRYAISLAVPGFRPSDLDISVRENELVVTGERKDEPRQDGDYLYRGIALRNFRRTFALADYVVVSGAELKDGLLRINLTREIPEALKPRRIDIRTGPDLKAIASPRKAA